MTTLTSHADVPTDGPARYAKQLVSHLGRKATFTEEADGAWTITVGDARGRIAVGDDVLSLHVEASDVETLDRLQPALGSHVERFGARAGLTVTWQRHAD